MLKTDDAIMENVRAVGVFSFFRYAQLF